MTTRGGNAGLLIVILAHALKETAGIDKSSPLPGCITFDEGVHNLGLLAAVSESPLNNGKQVFL